MRSLNKARISSASLYVRRLGVAVIAIARLTFADMAADSGVLLGINLVRSSFAIRFPLGARSPGPPQRRRAAADQAVSEVAIGQHGPPRADGLNGRKWCCRRQRPRVRTAKARGRVRLQAGVSQPRRVAVASNKNIENNPMQGKQAVAGKDVLGQYLTRRANQRHCFIIAQSTRRPRASSNNPPNQASNTAASVTGTSSGQSSVTVNVVRSRLARRRPGRARAAT